MNDKKREILNVRAIIQLRYNYNKIYVYILKKIDKSDVLNHIKLAHIIILSDINFRRLYYCYTLFPKKYAEQNLPNIKMHQN